jgi:predicted ribosome quality control (RQC) complex YloA/Tae2 family protein
MPVPAVVQRVDVTSEVVVLRLRLPGRTVFLVIVAAAQARGIGLVLERPFRGGPPPGTPAPVSEKRRWRSRLEGAHIEALGEREVLLAGGEGRFRVAIAASPAAVTLEEAGDMAPPLEPRASASGPEPRASASGPELDGGEIFTELEEALVARGETLVEALTSGAIGARRGELARALARASKRIERRIAAVEEDLSRIEQASAIAAQASAFVAEAARAPRGARSLTAMDWSSGEPRPIELSLDPARPAREQLDAMFKRARRLKQGGVIAGRRLAEAQVLRERLAALLAEVTPAATLEALATLAAEARKAAPRDFALASGDALGDAARGGRTGQGTSRPYRSFLGTGGVRILVGRGAAHNDALTFRIARPHDLWLHAKGRTGAHVIVPLEKASTCPAEVLVDAAHLAAHFSDARGEPIVEVQHTPRRYLRKPAAPPRASWSWTGRK